MFQNLPRPFFVLAPMDDVTDTVFRRIVHDCAPADLSMTEFVNVDGLCSVGRGKLLPKLSLQADTGPVIAQIWGKKPENFEQIAREISQGLLGDEEYESYVVSRKVLRDEEQDVSEAHSKTYTKYVEARAGTSNTAVRSEVSGALSLAGWQAKPVRFSGIDLNFGCPDKAVLKNECCSALAQPDLRDKARHIIEATMQGAGSMPVSIKTRLGFDKIDYSWHELLLSYKPAMLTVHVRTTRQMSKVPAQWEAITPIVELRNKLSPDTKIVLNGDIQDKDHGLELARQYGVDGIMIGRGVFKNPFCFADQAESLWASKDKAARVQLLADHFTLFQKTYPDGQRRFAPLKKFAKIYISDFAGASDLRELFMNANSVDEVLSLIREQ